MQQEPDLIMLTWEVSCLYHNCGLDCFQLNDTFRGFLSQCTYCFSALVRFALLLQLMSLLSWPRSACSHVSASCITPTPTLSQSVAFRNQL